MEEVYELIAKQYKDMSKTQQKIAKYILENRTRVSFFNIKTLAKSAEVSEASIVRFSTFLGYEGYPELQKHLQAATQHQLSIKERLTMSYDAYSEKEIGVKKVFDDDMNNIKNMLDSLDMDNFFNVIDEILKAKKIYIVAGRSAAALGIFFQYYLKMILGNVSLIESLNGDEEALSNLTKHDVVIGITFSKYTKNTIKIMEYAYNKGATTISLTDSFSSPLIPNSRYYLLTNTKMPTFLDSFVAPLSLINAIITYIGKVKNKALENRLQELEYVWNEFDIFE